MKQLLLLLLFIPFLSRAQTPLRGLVLDSQGRPVPFASVAVPALTQGTTADENGRFTLLGLPAGPHQLQISAVGYATATPTVTQPTDKPLVIRLASEDKPWPKWW